MRGLIVVFVVVGLVAFAAVAVEDFPRVMQTSFSAIESELEHNTGTVDTTPEDPTGLTPGSGYSFVAVVDTLLQNTDSTDNICWTVKPSSSLCDEIIDGGASDNITCDGSATDGSRVTPGQTVKIKWRPQLMRVCVVGSAAGVAYNATSEVIP
jgi:hypothetical protein